MTNENLKCICVTLRPVCTVLWISFRLFCLFLSYFCPASRVKLKQGLLKAIHFQPINVLPKQKNNGRHYSLLNNLKYCVRKVQKERTRALYSTIKPQVFMFVQLVSISYFLLKQSLNQELDGRVFLNHSLVKASKRFLITPLAWSDKKLFVLVVEVTWGMFLAMDQTQQVYAIVSTLCLSNSLKNSLETLRSTVPKRK